ncbi:MAG TPA: hypothetical protein VIQ62_02135, partial [Burkholderiales bacterium]
TPRRIPCIAHGAEFADHEGPAMEAGALLLENDRCADSYANNQRKRRQQWRKNQECSGRD